MKNNISNTLWNALAGIINALESVIILAIVSRINGLADAGILTIALSIANLLVCVGKFGVRNYQVAHENHDIKFFDFFIARLFSTFTMIFLSLVFFLYCYLFQNTDNKKNIVILVICLWYSIEAFEDVFIGSLQSIGRLDYGSKLFIIRWIFILGTFIISDIIFANIITSSVIALLVELFISIPLITKSYKYINSHSNSIENTSVNYFHILKNCFPLCCATFLSLYVTNIPRYRINSLLSDEVQAIYGYIAMPMFAISLLSSFIYQPQLMKYVNDWQNKNLASLKRRIITQIFIICTIICISLICAYFFGIPILSILYSENLYSFKRQLLILIFGAGLWAVGNYLGNILIITDHRNSIMLGYLLSSICGYIINTILISRYQLNGAVYGYCLTMFILLLLFISMTFVNLFKKKE